jgi:hypothetical protein
VRLLAQTPVMVQAALAAMATGAASAPRLAAWPDPPHALWFLLALLSLVSFVMWAFVFGWFPVHAKLALFRVRGVGRVWGIATFGGLAGAVFVGFALDPTLRVHLPGDYPASLAAWAGATLFHLSFVQLFLCFAPFAFFVRLLRHKWAAGAAVVLFGVVLLMSQVASANAALPTGFVVEMILVRSIFGALTLFLLVHGGVLPVWWWALLVQARLLPGLVGTGASW